MGAYKLHNTLPEQESSAKNRIMKKALYIFTIGLIAFLVIWGLMLRRDLRHERNRPARIDTIKVVTIDTLKIFEPVPVYVEVVKDRYIYITKDSLVFVGDSLQIPIERKTYQDSSFKAIITGFRPTLEYMEVYQKTIKETITIKTQPRKWGIGIIGGYGAGNGGFSPYFGVGLYYNIWTIKN